MMTRKKHVDPIPEEFPSYEEAAEFWDTHDTTDYPDAFRTVEVEAEFRGRYWKSSLVFSAFIIFSGILFGHFFLAYGTDLYYNLYCYETNEYMGTLHSFEEAFGSVQNPEYVCALCSSTLLLIGALRTPTHKT